MTPNDIRIFRHCMAVDQAVIETIDKIDSFSADSIDIAASATNDCVFMCLTNTNATRGALVKVSRSLLRKLLKDFDVAERTLKASRKLIANQSGDPA